MRQPVGIAGEGVRQHLDRDFAPQLGVDSTIRRAHRALADIAEDL
jgi:hypothetical protein